jgi:hypothetical protein
MEYVVRMKAYCSNNTASEWEKKTIKTTGCQSVTTCVKPEILSVTADSNKVTIVTNGNATTWYTIEYTAAPQTATSTWTNLASMSFTSVIPNLQKCKEYVVRVRTFCTQTLSSDWVYRTVKTTGCVQAICPKPTITNVLADSTKAGFTWTAIAGMTYQAAYTPNPVTATSAWTSISVTPNNGAYIVGLIKCKEYRVRVRTVCSSDYFSDWDYKTFKTIGCAVTTPCIKPAVLTSTPITGGTVLNWVGSSQCYQVRYAKKTTTAAVWKTDSICATTHTVLNLDACTFYAWQVRARCADGSWSDWTSKATFETGGCSERIAKTMNIYPNPGAYLNVDYYLRKSGKVSLEITNLQGISVGKYELGNQEVGQNKFNLDNLNFAAGSYLITIKLNGVRLEVQRWMKTTE